MLEDYRVFNRPYEFHIDHGCSRGYERRADNLTNVGGKHERARGRGEEDWKDERDSSYLASVSFFAVGSAAKA